MGNPDLTKSDLGAFGGSAWLVFFRRVQGGCVFSVRKSLDQGRLKNESVFEARQRKIEEGGCIFSNYKARFPNMSNLAFTRTWMGQGLWQNAYMDMRVVCWSRISCGLVHALGLALHWV